MPLFVWDSYLSAARANHSDSCGLCDEPVSYTSSCQPADVENYHEEGQPEELCKTRRMINREMAWYNQGEILRFKENNRFTSAISFWAQHPDMLAVASMKEGYPTEPKDFDQSHMSGMAGVSRDGEYLWQIGINVDKDYAGKGLGHGLVRALKEAVLRLGKVPFYGTSESHTLSQTVGLKAGFVPAWTEVSVREDCS